MFFSKSVHMQMSKVHKYFHNRHLNDLLRMKEMVLYIYHMSKVYKLDDSVKKGMRVQILPFVIVYLQRRLSAIIILIATIFIGMSRARNQNSKDLPCEYKISAISLEETLAVVVYRNSPSVVQQFYFKGFILCIKTQ